MKKYISIILSLIIIVALALTMLVGCSKTPSNDDTIKLIQEACKNTLASTQYYTRCDVGSMEYSINMWPDDGSVSGVDLTRAKITVADSSNIMKTEYSYEYFGASLPSSVGKVKNAKAEDYKTNYHFYTVDGKMVKKESTLEAFLGSDLIKTYTPAAIVGSIENITLENSTIKSSKTTGKVTDIILVVNTKCNTNENSVDLSTYANDSKLAVHIRVAYDKIALVEVRAINSSNEVDSNENAKFSYYISYKGANLPLFGQDCMPHYDEATDA
jgi:uncharacterized protein YcfL